MDIIIIGCAALVVLAIVVRLLLPGYSQYTGTNMVCPNCGSKLKLLVVPVRPDYQALVTVSCPGCDYIQNL